MLYEELTDGKVRQQMSHIDLRSCRHGARFQRHLFVLNRLASARVEVFLQWMWSSINRSLE